MGCEERLLLRNRIQDVRHHIPVRSLLEISSTVKQIKFSIVSPINGQLRFALSTDATRSTEQESIHRLQSCPSTNLAAADACYSYTWRQPDRLGSAQSRKSCFSQQPGGWPRCVYAKTDSDAVRQPASIPLHKEEHLVSSLGTGAFRRSIRRWHPCRHR